MALDRVDVRAKVDPDMHEALVAICDAKGVTLGEFIEALLVPEIKRLVHEATVIADKLRRTPASGNGRESQGVAGKQRTWAITDHEGRRTEFSEKTRG
jgi:hypothetical protein